MRHAWWVLAALLLCPACWGQRPQATVPPSDDTVIARLPKGYAALGPRAGSTEAPSLARAQMLLAAAARYGDARLAARADAILAKMPGAPSPALLQARAFSAQHRHDFEEAVALLDRLVAQAPRDGRARLARAQIRLVQGKLDLAKGDCAVLALGVDQASGQLCLASYSLRRSDYSAAASLAGRWLDQAQPTDPALRGVLVMRAEIGWKSGMEDAEDWYRRALLLDREDVRTVASYARYLRAKGRFAEVESLLAPFEAHDGLQLQRALAAHAAGTPEHRSLARAQARRYATAQAAGTEPELRDQAEFELVLRGDAMAALALASRNFQDQRDTEDVEILRRAASAAGKPGALEGLHAWARSQGLVLPAESPAWH